MARTRFRLAPTSLVHVAVLALAGLGCQSDGEGGSGGADDAEAAPAEPASVVRVRERSADVERDPTEAPSASAGGAPASRPDEDVGSDLAPEAAAETTAPAATFAACISSGGAYSDCETIFVSVVQASPERCIQLTIDNCGTYDRQGLSADTPTAWRLASGSVGSDAESCELGVFYAGSSSLADATGTIAWDEATPSPTELTFDLTLETSALAADGQDIPLATVEPLQPVDCEE